MVGEIVRISSVWRSSFDPVVLARWIDVVLVPSAAAVLMLETDVVPPRIARAECSTEFL